MRTRRSLLALAGLPAAALAQTPAGANATPVGTWETIDDHSGKATGIVRIFLSQGQVYGDVERVFDPAKAGAVCQKCTDDRHGKPVIGLQVIRGLKPDGHSWDGGTILDPETGTTYRCSMRLTDDGRKLVVRGYVGISLLGRSQTWIRMG